MRWPSGYRAALAVVITLIKYKSFSRALFSKAHPSLKHSAAYIDDTLCDVIGCYRYDVNSAAAAAQGAKDKDGSSTVGASAI